jgi:erythromycin esterase
MGCLRVGPFALGCLMMLGATASAAPTTTTATADPAQAAAPPAVQAWLRHAAAGLATVEPEHDDADLRPLQAAIGDARIVGLGQATRATHESLRLSQRLVQLLVERLGFRIIVLEADFAATLAVEDYVLNGHGDPRVAVAQLGWAWRSDELLSLVEWMRRYDADPRHVEKVELYGIDPQNGQLARRYVDRYLQAVDPAARELTTQRLLGRFEEQRAAWIARSSVGEWTLARQCAIVAEQAELLSRVERAGELRDAFLAANTQKIRAAAPAGARLVLLAHDQHVALRASTDGAGVDGRPRRTMGGLLREQLGLLYLPLGFVFDRGDFIALALSGAFPMWRRFTVPSTGPGGLGATLATVAPRLFIDLRHAPAGAVGDWLRRPLASWSVDTLFGGEPPTPPVAIAPALDFDGLLFVAETTATRPLANVTPAGADGPQNLDFEAGAAGQSPPGWVLIDISRSQHYRFLLSTDDPRRGRLAARLAAPEGGVPTMGWGGIKQTIDAAPYRLARIRLRMPVRLEPQRERDHAQAWLRIDRADGSLVFIDTMETRPISADSWAAYDLFADVPADAATIHYGVMLYGEGAVSVDDVSVQVVP